MRTFVRTLLAYLPWLAGVTAAVLLAGGSAMLPMLAFMLAALIGLLIFGAPLSYRLLTRWRARRGLPHRTYWTDLPTAPRDWPVLATLFCSIGVLFPLACWLSVTWDDPDPILHSWVYTVIMLVAPMAVMLVPDMLADLHGHRRDSRHDDQRAAPVPQGFTGWARPPRLSRLSRQDRALLAAETITAPAPRREGDSR